MTELALRNPIAVAMACIGFVVFASVTEQEGQGVHRVRVPSVCCSSVPLFGSGQLAFAFEQDGEVEHRTGVAGFWETQLSTSCRD